MSGACAGIVSTGITLQYRASHSFKVASAVAYRDNGSMLAASSETIVRGYTHFCLRSFCGLWFEAKNMSQAAMNIAATTGPITKPLRPKIAIPPSVEISTT